MPPGNYTLTFTLDGFNTIARDGIHVALAFTSTVNVEMMPGAISDRVTVTTHFDADKLASLPCARAIFAVLASTPAVAMSRMDVGGNWALGLLEYTAYEASEILPEGVNCSLATQGSIHDNGAASRPIA